MITVWHNQAFLAFSLAQYFPNSKNSAIEPQNLITVAMVRTDSLGSAYEAVQHHETSWHDNSDIIVLEKSRSTSIGDVLQKDDGSCWVVDRQGFKEIDIELAVIEVPGSANQ